MFDVIAAYWARGRGRPAERGQKAQRRHPELAEAGPHGLSMLWWPFYLCIAMAEATALTLNCTSAQQLRGFLPHSRAMVPRVQERRLLA
eukprot:6393876-Pyramimonas_sp.AAC.1